MTKYLMIENPGEAPLEAFTILGLSTARGCSDSIGQFGSGNKHAVNVLLRAGIPPIIYSGKEKVSFLTQSANMGKKQYDKVLVQFGNAKPKDCGWCLEFGELDWTTVDMALREFVSNAIDQGGVNAVDIDFVETPRAKSGYTRVFVPVSIEVKQFFIAIKDWFLHFDKLESQKILQKKSEGTAKIYRKGVFVRELLKHNKKSYFDYNFGDELQIDESRRLDDYACKFPAAQVLSQSFDKLCQVLRTFQGSEEYWEHSFSEFALNTRGNELKNAWLKVFGNAIVAMSSIECQAAERKGKKAIVVSENWYRVLSKVGVLTVDSVVNHIEKSNTILKATEKTIKTFDSVWYWLSELNMTNGKSKPEVLSFEGLMDGGSVKMGYYHDNCVYINTESESNPQVMFEELAHHITGSNDNSRDFQDFAFKAATNACKILCDLDLL